MAQLIPQRIPGWRLIRNSSWNLAVYLLYVGLTFVSLPLFLRCLGSSHYGVLVLLGSITAPLGFLNLGFAQATVKYVSEKVAAGDSAGAARYVSNTLWFNLATGILGASALVWLAPVLSTRLFELSPLEQPLLCSCVRWTALTWVSTQTAAAFTAVPTALQRFGITSAGTAVFSSGNLLLSLVPLLMGHGLLAVAKIRFVWSLVGVVGWIWIARGLLPQISAYPCYEADAFRKSFRFSLWQTVATAGGVLANQSDKYLLGAYLSAEAVGIFNVPYLIFSTIFTMVSKVSESAFPAVSALEGRGDPHKAVEVLLRGGAWVSLLMVCLQGTVYVFAADILRLYVGRQIADAGAQALRIFAITAVIAAPSLLVNQYLLGTGATAWLALMAAAGGVLTLLISWALIPRYGLAGAAWSDLAAILVSRPVSHWAIWRCRLRRRVSGRAFGAALYRATLVGIPLTLGLGWCRARMTWAADWPGLIVGLVLTPTLFGLALVVVERWLPGTQKCSKDLALMAQAVRALRG